ncbi:hypothetical protein B0O99DRAFT_614221 [Bisporella sp. PMI_857]|nr:hypothetical protein B0O99DRAFT_614221 [Bisporella sp. PMI_857]
MAPYWQHRKSYSSIYSSKPYSSPYSNKFSFPASRNNSTSHASGSNYAAYEQDHEMEIPDSPPGDEPSSPTASFPSNGQASGAGGKVNHGAPGSSYGSKKFLDDYTQTFNRLLDQNTEAHTRFGDPLLEKLQYERSNQQ